MGIKNFEKLYEYLGQKTNYTSQEVADVIDVDKFRIVKKIKGKNYKFDMGPVSSLIEAEGRTLDELSTAIGNTLHRFYLEEVERMMEGQDVRSYRIETFTTDRTDGECFKLVVRLEDSEDREDDKQVYARLVDALTQRAARARANQREREHQEANRKMRRKDFVNTLALMGVSDEEKVRLIDQYDDTCGA